MWIIVGLGNPGKKYAFSRHNVGFALIQRLADKNSVKLKKRKYSAKAAQVELANSPALLVKPWTYMNRSGVAVTGIIEGMGVNLDRVLVVYDDLDIPLGEVRIRKAGGPGTHKGMVSIVQEIGSTEFPRIRIGIGPLPPGVDATDYVLDDFQKEENPILEDCLIMAEEAVDLIMKSGVDEAMNRFNRRPAPPQLQGISETEE
ncbi:MAG: aminoacyl-tRNA hydrolase [Candidatus Aminicenantes bacterium]|nr:MAG: aminoacyl-tRNA hydrolase [Candidatus Aminicenantes bacterium]